MKNALFLAVMAAATLAGCGVETQAGSSAESSASGIPDMSMAERDQLWAIKMEDRVRAKLRDPGSAKFEGTKTFHGGGAPVACGRVNSNNAFGGKAGFQRFIAAGEIIALEEEMADGEMDKTWALLCRA